MIHIEVKSAVDETEKASMRAKAASMRAEAASLRAKAESKRVLATRAKTSCQQLMEKASTAEDEEQEQELPEECKICLNVLDYCIYDHPGISCPECVAEMIDECSRTTDIAVSEVHATQCPSIEETALIRDSVRRAKENEATRNAILKEKERGQSFRVAKCCSTVTALAAALLQIERGLLRQMIPEVCLCGCALPRAGRAYLSTKHRP